MVLNNSHFDTIDFEYLLNSLAGDPEFSSSDENVESLIKNDDDINSVLSSSSSENETRNCCLCPLKKKRKTRHDIRIVKHDIRRSYSHMFANVLNSFNFFLLFGFLDTYCSPQFENCSKKYAHKNERVIESKSINSYEIFAKFLFMHLLIKPDSVFRITNTQYFLSQDKTCSKIVCKYSCKGTEIYDLKTDGWDSICHSHAFPIKTFENSSKKDNQLALNNIRSFINATNEISKSFCLLENPYESLTEGTLTFVLNENNQVKCSISL
jgi:hypothetical protein